MKKLLFLILIYIMLISPIPTFAAPATSGECGENIKWSYDSPTATLTIGGTGDMPDYTLSTDDEAPWHRFESRIRNVVIKDGVTSIGNYSFRFYELLSNVSIASSVKEIGSNAFSHCKSLCIIDIPEGVETIGIEAFDYCENLQKISFHKTLKTIKNSAFQHCPRLQDVKFPSKIEKIGSGAFSDCLGIKTIEIPEGVERIEEGCFASCENLELVILPSTLIRVKDSAFANCKKITKVIYKGTEKQWNEIKFKDNNENIQYANIEYKKINSKGFIIAFVILLVVTLTIFICKKKKYKYLIPIFAALIILLMISTLNNSPSHNESVKSNEEPILSGMYHQELGKNSYDPNMGILFKDNNEIAFKDYNNVNHFDNWSKENSDGNYRISKSDLEEYDYMLKVYGGQREQVYYIQAENKNDILTLYEYTPDSDFTIGFFGKYLSERFCSKNGYTEFDWNSQNIN